MQRPYKLIIAGPKDYTNRGVVFGAAIWYLSNKENIEIVSGGCRGVDKLGEEFARYKGWPVKLFPYIRALGKAGGPVRNRDMAEYADGLLAFWDGESTGTNNMINTANKLGLDVRVVRIDQHNKFADLWYAVEKLGLNEDR